MWISYYFLLGSVQLTLKKKHCLFKVIEKIDCKDKVFLTSDLSLLAMRFKLSKLLWHCALLTMVFYCNLKWNVYFLTPTCFGSKYTSCVFLWCNKLNLSFYLLLCLICILWQITLFIHVTGHLVNSESISSYCTWVLSYVVNILLRISN